MVVEEELKELKELNINLRQKLTSVEEMYDNVVESHSKEITESNERVYTCLDRIFTTHIQLHFILCAVLRSGAAAKFTTD